MKKISKTIRNFIVGFSILFLTLGFQLNVSAMDRCDDQLDECAEVCWDYLTTFFEPLLATLCFDYCGAQWAGCELGQAL